MALHPSDDDIDDYVRERLHGASRDSFESHVLKCPDCHRRLELVVTLRDAVLGMPSGSEHDPSDRVE
jgi:hypothetical protein